MLPAQRVLQPDRARHDRGRAAGVHARPHAQRQLRDPRRGAEHHDRADADVPDAPRPARKAVITGDVTQVDLPQGTSSGLRRRSRCSATSTASRAASSRRPTWCATRWCSASSRLRGRDAGRGRKRPRMNEARRPAARATRGRRGGGGAGRGEQHGEHRSQALQRRLAARVARTVDERDGAVCVQPRRRARVSWSREPVVGRRSRRSRGSSRATAACCCSSDAPPGSSACAAAGAARAACPPRRRLRPLCARARTALLERARAARQGGGARAQQLARYRYELGELIEIARAITTERDIDKLLGLILEKSRFVTGADAGSIYVVEGDDERRERPRAALQALAERLGAASTRASSRCRCRTQLDRRRGGARRASRSTSPTSTTLDAEHGRAASTARFDERIGYRTRSMLTVPLISARGRGDRRHPADQQEARPAARSSLDAEDFEREVVAVRRAQRGAARRRSRRRPASRSRTRCSTRRSGASSRASCAPACRRSSSAIRRPAVTRGASPSSPSGSPRRSTATSDGPYRDVRFSARDLQRARVRGAAPRLRQDRRARAGAGQGQEALPARARADPRALRVRLKAAEAELLERKLDADRARARAASELDALDERARDAQARELDDAWRVDRARRTSRPCSSEGDFERIAEIGAIDATSTLARRDAAAPRAQTRSIALQITRGSLSPSEIDEIRSHVVHTFNFLSQIPWGKHVPRVPEIAGAHHEKLNGTRLSARLRARGDPAAVEDDDDRRHLRRADRDRPPVQEGAARRARARHPRLRGEGRHLDAELVRIFREAEIYKSARSVAGVLRR